MAHIIGFDPADCQLQCSEILICFSDIYYGQLGNFFQRLQKQLATDFH